MTKKILRSAAIFAVLLITACLGGFFALTLENSGIIGAGAAAAEPVAPNLPAPTARAVTDDAVDADVWIAETVRDAVVTVSNHMTLVDGVGAEVESGVGSGVLIDARGYIVTNRHVVADSARLLVTLADGSVYEAALVGADERTDLALLKIEGGDFPCATLGDSDNLAVGQKAVAIGNPGGADFANSVTSGIISGLDRPLITGDGLRFKLIQTDAAINPGNSGGALVNSAGEVVGINTVKISEAGYEGMGFAIPANLVREIAAELLAEGKITRPALGVGLLRNVDAGLNELYGFGSDYGVVISVQKDGPADLSGLQEYDIIIAIDGERVDDLYDLQDNIFARNVGDTVTLTVIRQGKSAEVQVTLGELDDGEN